ncbi:unnamed protein product [Protopolystoma xenopodis]|uniref:Uncharacterized protein n=1 Tax=Protopolystoma xenopodis TaxID=117903 RepID=A0A448XFT2_9PLAT|nr:unnamed protein product [Protopolystoma xenopodis]
MCKCEFAQSVATTGDADISFDHLRDSAGTDFATAVETPYEDSISCNGVSITRFPCMLLSHDLFNDSLSKRPGTEFELLLGSLNGSNFDLTLHATTAGLYVLPRFPQGKICIHKCLFNQSDINMEHYELQSLSKRLFLLDFNTIKMITYSLPFSEQMTQE